MSKASELSKLLQAIVEEQPAELRDNAQKDASLILKEEIESFDDMIALLYNKKTSVELRSIIYWFLGQIRNDKSLSVLMDFFDREIDEKLIWEIAKSLSIVESKPSVQALCLMMMNAQSVSKRTALAYVLGRLQDHAATGCLIQVLSNLHEHEIVRSHAAESLGLLRDTRAFDSLLKTLADPSVSVRFWTAYALGELKDQRAIQPLKELAEADNSILEGWWAIKKEALDAIEKITGKGKSFF